MLSQNGRLKSFSRPKPQRPKLYIVMAEMTPFRYGGFYDVPRCLTLRYRGRRFLLLSAFDDNLDEYPTDYSVYIVPESADDSMPVCSPEFLSNTPIVCIGQIPIDQVTFDLSKRKELDASCLDNLCQGSRSTRAPGRQRGK
jgi:hypothetical protein